MIGLQGRIVWLVGCSTSGESHEESPSIDVDVCETVMEASVHLLEIFDEHYGDPEDRVHRQALREKVCVWRDAHVLSVDDEIDGFFHDDEMGTIYYIVPRRVGARTIVS